MPIPESKKSGEPETPNSFTLTAKDASDAARLLRLISDSSLLPRGQSERSPAFRVMGMAADREPLISRARIAFQSRRLRERYFDHQLFSEPAWDILLLLYITEHSSARLTTTRLAELIETPLTTVVRWLNYLETAHLVERHAHPTDRRTMFISLLEKGRSALDSYLASIPG